MELKKSRKYDLERTRPIRLVLSFMSVIAAVAMIASAPFIISAIMQSKMYDDETIEDLNIEFDEEDEMIAAVQTEVQDEVTEILKPVETVTEAIEPPEVNEMEAVKEEIVETETPPDVVENIPEELPMQESEDAKPIDRPDQEDLELAEQLPEYPGGMTEFVTWLTRTIKYPPQALKQRIKGEVQISFFIEKDGSLTDIKVYKSANPMLDEEALRVAKMMPNWKPGKRNGKICRTFFVVPIEFNPIQL